ncbi:hypothetical protein, partial [Bosea sp. (in: a-proteobacteria)]|uniref:hypothetical protein n=1 Tax=Bosea sp. (in: a-proteobacteria) TaxID=1871050 RepID=UPI004033E7E4
EEMEGEDEEDEEEKQKQGPAKKRTRKGGKRVPDEFSKILLKRVSMVLWPLLPDLLWSRCLCLNVLC